LKNNYLQKALGFLSGVKALFASMLILMAMVPLTGMQCWKWGGGKLIDVWEGDFGNN
jgi:hypothetical protein